MIVRLIGLAVCCALTPALAQPSAIPEAETAYVPSRDRLAAVIAAGESGGWARQVASLRAAALRAYARDNLVAANAWFHLYAWASVFAEPEGAFASRWVDNVNAAKVGHPNMRQDFSNRPTPLGNGLSAPLRAWLIGDAAFSDEFFGIVSPLDYMPRVFEILDGLYHADTPRFKAYSKLALAMAIVYDVPPPPQWPHGQVTARALPRQFGSPTDTFAWWVREDQLSRTYHRLKKLGVEDLKFVVDSPAPLAELEWAQQSMAVPLSELPRLYMMIRYRVERATHNEYIWAAPTYRLPDILATGGICADQAYFATEVGKAHGVPTLFFRGAGMAGRHAWFGYLDGEGQWQLDAGRYAERRYVTGYAFDPQTWREFSDHELQFLKLHFRALTSFRQSQVHTAFAQDLLSAGDAAAAAVAARKAVNYERRNPQAWEALIAAVQKKGGDAKAAELVMREAALAFRSYPDLEASYVERVAESLRLRGQSSEADAEIRHIAHKNQESRVDISVGQAKSILQRSLDVETFEQQVHTYNSILDTFGPGAGMTFFDQVVVVFAEHLVQLQRKPDALRAIERAQRVLGVEAGSQLEAELGRLRRYVEAAK